MGETELDGALASDWTDFEDALVYQAALSTHPDAIITRNQKDFTGAKLPVFNCPEFFAWLAEHEGVSYAEVDLFAVRTFEVD